MYRTTSIHTLIFGANSTCDKKVEQSAKTQFASDLNRFHWRRAANCDMRVSALAEYFRIHRPPCVRQGMSEQKWTVTVNIVSMTSGMSASPRAHGHCTTTVHNSRRCRELADRRCARRSRQNVRTTAPPLTTTTPSCRSACRA